VTISVTRISAWDLPLEGSRNEYGEVNLVVNENGRSAPNNPISERMFRSAKRDVLSDSNEFQFARLGSDNDDSSEGGISGDAGDVAMGVEIVLR
jgi:hypothetical protein